jgi:hypothetical protein
MASTRPATSSIASGIPSSFRQIWATTGAFALSSDKESRMAAARSTKSSTAEKDNADFALIQTLPEE